MPSDPPPLSSPARADPLDAQGLASVLRSLPGTAALVLAPDAPRFTILDVTDEYLRATLKQRHEVVGHALFDVLPDANPANPAPTGVESLRASLERVLATGEADRMPVTRYDVVGADGASWHERYWAPHNAPARGPDGGIRALIHIVRDVTGEVLGGKAVQAAERRAVATLQRMADAYTLLDRDFRIIAVNAATEKALGRSRGELLGRSHWEVFPASFDSPLGRAYRRVVAEGIEQHLTQHYAGDGIDKHLEIDAYPTDDGGVAIFWRDTTEHHTARERLEMAVSIAKLGLFEWHLPSAAVRIDARTRELFGFGPDEPVTAALMFERMHPEDAGRVRELTLESVRLGRPIDVEYRLLLPDGRVRYISSAAQMLGGPDGETVQMFGVFADISDRVLADQALRNSEARFRTIANAMPQMLWSTLPNGYHDYYNDRWYEYTGVPYGSTDGDGWNDVFHPDDRPQAWERWQQSLRTGEPYEIEYRLRHRSGEYRWVLGRALPIRDDAGRIVRWMGTCTDVHDQKTTRDELANQNRRKDEFLAMLAHELRNPLAPITAAAYLLTAAGNDPTRVKRSAEIISRQAQHLTSLLNDLLDVSRVTRGLVELRKLPVDLKAVLAQAVEQCRPLIEARGHKLTTHSDPGEAVVLGDEPRLIQVVANLLTNAARYTPPDGHLQLALHIDGGSAVVQVSDNGIGIEPELLPNIFDLFVQGRRTPDRSQGGLGLGLALVKNLVELHDGSIVACSGGRGQGSTFEVRLPLAAATAPDADSTSTGRHVPGTALRILLVDDNADAVETFELLLGEEGHRVRSATDVDRALELAASEAFDVFILDIGLPKIDGYELARRIRAMPGTGDATFIALSGYGQDTDKQASREAGFDHHLVKPVDLAALNAVLVAAAAGK